MFILRVYTEKEKVESNEILGLRYNLVSKSENPVEFERTLTEVFKRMNEDVIYAFLTYNDGANVRPLYKDQAAYIMTERGQTFANVSDR